MSEINVATLTLDVNDSELFDANETRTNTLECLSLASLHSLVEYLSVRAEPTKVKLFLSFFPANIRLGCKVFPGSNIESIIDKAKKVLKHCH